MGQITEESLDEIEWTMKHVCVFCGRTNEEIVDFSDYYSPDQAAITILSDAGWEIINDGAKSGLACVCCTETNQGLTIPEQDGNEWINGKSEEEANE